MNLRPGLPLRRLAAALAAATALVVATNALAAQPPSTANGGGAAAAASAEAVPADPAFEQRLKRLSDELRCLVCQNQTLYDSHAELAVDLRNQVRDQMVAGRSDAQIKDWLVERYGDFVLYRPPVQGNTWLLWFGPFVALAIGMAVWIGVQRRSGSPAAAPASREPAATADPALDAERLAQARRLLDD